MSKLAKEAGINRVTLYHHFDDKFDIIEEIEAEVLVILEKVITEAYSHSHEKDFLKHRVDYLDLLLTAIYDQRKRLRLLLGKNGEASFRYKFQAFLSKTEYKGIGLLEKETTIDNRLFATFFTNAYLGVIEEWIQKESQLSLTDVKRFLVDITERMLRK